MTEAYPKAGSLAITPADFERAKAYALGRLERELPPHLTYHSLWHTRDDVAPATERLATLEHIGEAERRLLLTAAYYHDIGFVEQRLEHEAVSARLAGEVLPGFGYSPAQVQAIQGMIMATRLPQSPHTLLEQILADADLDALGRDDFTPRNIALRTEWAAFGETYTDVDWLLGQVTFVSAHRYWTRAARTLRDAGKEKNLADLHEQLKPYRAGSDQTT